jgi:ribonuclease R
MQKGSQRKLFNKAIQGLISKQVLRTRKNGSEVMPENEPGKMALAEGPVTFNRYGVGFVKIGDGTTEIRIPRKRTALALPGDTVRVKISSDESNDRLEGKITHIIKRSGRIYVGTIKKEGKSQFHIEPDEKSAPVTFFVLGENTKNAKNNDKVTFELVDWIHPRSLPEASVIEVLGPKGSNDAAMLSVSGRKSVTQLIPARG